MDLEMVKLSLSILASESHSIFDSGTEASAPGRAFALRALEKYSGVTIPQAEFDVWKEKGTLPPSLLLSTWTDMALSEVREQLSNGYVMKKKANGDLELVRPYDQQSRTKPVRGK